MSAKRPKAVRAEVYRVGIAAYPAALWEVKDDAVLPVGTKVRVVPEALWREMQRELLELRRQVADMQCDWCGTYGRRRK